jgi:hypothetical protein
MFKSILAALFLLSAPAAFAQVAPDITNKTEYSLIMVPGARFNLSGASPVSLGIGSGVQLTYLFGGFNVNIGGQAVPIFGIGGLALGSLNTTGSLENISLSCGPEVLILDRVSIGFVTDLISGGSNGLTGLLPGKVGLNNLAPVIFWSLPLGNL